jgi:hypothetical protein
MTLFLDKRSSTSAPQGMPDRILNASIRFTRSILKWLEGRKSSPRVSIGGGTAMSVQPTSQYTAPIGPVWQGPLNRTAQHNGWLTLLTLEYKHAAERYENLYKAIWQNFSYMAVLAAALLTFGGGKLYLPFLLFVALLPFLFWFVATFLPMDMYGERTRTRLSEIEQQLNNVYFSRPGDPQLSHFLDFAKQRKPFQIRPPWSVKHIVYALGLAVTIGVIYFGSQSIAKGLILPPHSDTNVTAPLTRDSTAAALRTSHEASLGDSIGAVSIRTRRLESQVTAINLKVDSPLVPPNAPDSSHRVP